MRQLIRRVAGTFRRPQHRPIPPEAASAELDGCRFTQVHEPAEFAAAIAGERRVALRLSTSDYAAVRSVLVERLRADHEPDSPEYYAFVHAELVCAGCTWPFPGAVTVALQLPDAPDDAATCPDCGSRESLLVYENVDPAEIDEADVAALRRWWQHCARTNWWAADRRSGGRCERCGRRVTAADAFLLHRADLLCAGCVDEHLTDGLDRLRDDPYFFGVGALRRARPFR